MKSRVLSVALALGCLSLLAAVGSSAAETAPTGGSAETVIAASGAPAAFESAPSAYLFAVRHRASGVVCAFGANPPSNKLFLLSGAAAAPSDAFTCSTALKPDWPVIMSLGVVRSDDPRAVEAIFKQAAGAVPQFLKEAAPYDGTSPAPTPGQPVLDRSYQGKHVASGRPLWSRIRATRVGAWVMFSTAIGPLDRASEANQIASEAFDKAVAGVRR